jgi:hypothetical protein
MRQGLIVDHQVEDRSLDDSGKLPGVVAEKTAVLVERMRERIGPSVLSTVNYNDCRVFF